MFPVEEKVYATKSDTLNDLREQIEQPSYAMPLEITESVSRSVSYMPILNIYILKVYASETWCMLNRNELKFRSKGEKNIENNLRTVVKRMYN